MIRFAKLALLTISLLPPSAFAGFGAHGGDICELEYRHLVADVVDASYLKPIADSVQADQLKKSLEATKVSCTDAPLVIDGEEKTAITDTNAGITKVNTDRWHQASMRSKKSLVLHEGLVLLGLEKTNDYHLSLAVMAVEGRNLFPKIYSCEYVKIAPGIVTQRVFGSLVLWERPSQLTRVIMRPQLRQQTLMLALGEASAPANSIPLFSEAVMTVVATANDKDDYDLSLQVFVKGQLSVERTLKNLIARSGITATGGWMVAAGTGSGNDVFSVKCSQLYPQSL